MLKSELISKLNEIEGDFYVYTPIDSESMFSEYRMISQVEITEAGDSNDDSSEIAIIVIQ